jgi:hypothetical protein
MENTLIEPGARPSACTVESEIPRARTVLEAPRQIRGLVENSTAGLRRIVVSVVHGRNNHSKLNAVRMVGAKHNQATDGDTLERALELVMKMISGHLEQEQTAQVYRVVPFIVDADGKSKRAKGADVPFAGIFDAPVHDKAEEQGDSRIQLHYQAQQNRHCLALLGECRAMLQENRQTLKVVATYSETLAGRLSDALVREREASEAKAQALLLVEQDKKGHELELAKMKQRGEFMDMFKPLVGKATQEIGTKAADALRGNSAEKSKANNPLAAMSAGPPQKVDMSEEEKLEAELDKLKESDPDLYAVRVLMRSLDDEQTNQVREVLGAEAFACVTRARDASSNDDALDALVEMTELAPKDTATQLLSVLNGEQQSVLTSVYFAAKAHQDTRDAD